MAAERGQRLRVIEPGRLPVAVLDTSVLVSLWSRIVLQRLADPRNPAYVPVWSEWIIGETWRVLTRRWVEEAAGVGLPVDWARLSKAANGMMRRLLDVMQMVSLARRRVPRPWPGHPDPHDEPVWATAKLARADYIVCDDLAVFPPVVDGRHLVQGVEYLTPIEFVEDVLGHDARAVHGRDLPEDGVRRSQRQPGLGAASGKS